MIDLFLDCGAFTAYSQNKLIDLKKYHKFCFGNHKEFNIIASLDDIGSWQNSLSNFKKLNGRGRYMPCFHQGEPFDLLKIYLEESNYIALGGMVGGVISTLPSWIKQCFNIIKKFKNKKIHGFGLTNQKLIFSNPWESIDSATWVRCSRMGIILIPRKQYGKINYKLPPRRIQISDKGAHKNSADSHIDNLSLMERNNIMNIIKEKGFSFGKSEITKPEIKFGVNIKKAEAVTVKKGLCNDYILRDLFNMCYMQEMEKAWGKKIYLAGGGIKDNLLLEKCKEKGVVFRKLVSFAYKSEIKKILKLSKGVKNENKKKRTLKRIR